MDLHMNVLICERHLIHDHQPTTLIKTDPSQLQIKKTLTKREKVCSGRWPTASMCAVGVLPSVRACARQLTCKHVLMFRVND